VLAGLRHPARTHDCDHHRGNLTADYYAAKAFVYAASKNLIYPLRSFVFRRFENIATKATPVSALLALNYCIYYCLYEEAKCERLF
jgi:hypothetical protein